MDTCSVVSRSSEIFKELKNLRSLLFMMYGGSLELAIVYGDNFQPPSDEDISKTLERIDKLIREVDRG